MQTTNNPPRGPRTHTINIHAGHNPDGKTGCGAVGLIRESTEARAVKDKIAALLAAAGHTVYDCTVDDGVSQNDVLAKIVKKCNSHSADLDLSIHFNAGRNDFTGDGSIGGVEVWVYDSASPAADAARRVLESVAALGFKNRGVKIGKALYVLRKTAAPAMLVECCFVDDADDVRLYDADRMAKAIADGILNALLHTNAPTPPKDDDVTGGNPGSVSVKVPDAHEAAPGSKEPPASPNFRVKITASALNIRSGPGTNYAVAGCIRDHGTYTITQTNGHWGKLKSGAGWICISDKYAKRC